MSLLDFVIHLGSFIAPAFFVALVLALGARVLWPRRGHLLPWYLMAVMNVLLGVLVLALGVVVTGQDGRMATYAVLVLAMGSCQWLLSGGWRA